MSVFIDIPKTFHTGMMSPEKPDTNKLNTSMTPLSEASTASPFSGSYGFFEPGDTMGIAMSGSTQGLTMESDAEDLLELLAPAYAGVALEDYMETEDQEFLLDNSRLRASTKGLAFRASKSINDRDHNLAGPAWGTSIRGHDEGDGWVRVGDCFLPMCLDGAQVLRDGASVGPVAAWDGPALTMNGCAMDLDGGTSIFFSHSKDHSLSHGAKTKAIEDAHMFRAMKAAHTACEAEAKLIYEEVCSVDPLGVVRGVAALKAPSRTDCLIQMSKRKVRHQKKTIRASTVTMAASGVEKQILCADEDGKVFLYLYLIDPKASRSHRIRSALGRQDSDAIQDADNLRPVVIADSDGVLRGCRKGNAAPPVMPAHDPECELFLGM